jgi:hypothetical protein
VASRGGATIPDVEHAKCGEVFLADFGSSWKMLCRTRPAKFDLHLRENRNGPVDRNRMGVWGTTWTLAWYLRRQPNFRGLAPRTPPKKISKIFFEFLEQIRSRSAVRNEPRHELSMVLGLACEPPTVWGLGLPKYVNIFPENLDFATKIHRKHLIFIA